MKILVYLLAFLFLTNCYSYKNVTEQSQNNSFSDTKVYELKLKNKSKVLVRNLKIENENYVFNDFKKNEKSLPINDVTTIKERKFSWGKTIALSVGTLGVATAIVVAIALSDMRISMGEMHMPQ